MAREDGGCLAIGWRVWVAVHNARDEHAHTATSALGGATIRRHIHLVILPLSDAAGPSEGTISAEPCALYWNNVAIWNPAR
jgi:hypothetical protein